MFCSVTDKSKGRETLLIPVVWENDWPIFNEGKALQLRLEVPNGYILDHPTGWRDDFSSSEMQLGWYRKSLWYHKRSVTAAADIWQTLRSRSTLR